MPPPPRPPPPKIASLVQFFEQQQQQRHQTSPVHPGLNTSGTGARLTSQSPPPRDTRRGGQVDDLATGGAGEDDAGDKSRPLDLRRTTVDRHVLMHEDITSSRPSIDVRNATKFPDAVWKPKRAAPAPPVQSKANVTNVKSQETASEAVARKLFDEAEEKMMDRSSSSSSRAPSEVKGEYDEPANHTERRAPSPHFGNFGDATSTHEKMTRPKDGREASMPPSYPPSQAPKYEGEESQRTMKTDLDANVRAATYMQSDEGTSATTYDPPSHSDLEGHSRRLSAHARAPSSPASTLVCSPTSKCVKDGQSRTTSSRTGPPSSNRPSYARSSATSSSIATRDLPSNTVFNPKTAKPLSLPLLDAYLDSIPEPKFSPPESVLTEEELVGWEEWLEGAQNSVRPSRWRSLLNRMKALHLRGTQRTYVPTGTADDGPHIQAHQAEGKKNPSIDRVKRALIFPPMHRVPPDLTVTDLKLNRTKKAPFFTLNQILSTGINAVLGGEGSSYAISLMKVEAFRDLVQLIGLGISFASKGPPGLSPSLASTTTSSPPTNSGTKKLLLQTIPSVLGLDFVSAFGHSILWLWVFTLICLAACYEFKNMAGGVFCGSVSRYIQAYQNEPGEGLDFEQEYRLARRGGGGGGGGRPKVGAIRRLRSSRGYRILIIFLITSLYVPLSKISIGALAWTSDFWAVENYYALQDDPSPSPLGSSEQYRDPLDFCYSTTMRRGSFNWAIPILVVASFTVLVVTIWFPIRLWSVVHSQVPKVDAYTELGERRKDVSSEYARMLDRDRSPFSFIYRDYRRRWAGFKSAYMALKLINVLAITILSKDNCLFRTKPRMHLDVVRQGTLLAFMSCWMILQVWAKPFNDRLSNNSDWCSRIAYVLIALLGLFAALNLPGEQAYNGGLLMTVTVISYICNAYFSLIGTGVAQRMVKRLSKRLDFSIDVYNPNLDIPKHIARRIQQEFFSTLLLTEADFKIPSGERLYFGTIPDTERISSAGPASDPMTVSDELPPYLLAFQGSQGERHVENLKILREIGLERYVAAVDSTRPPQGKSSRMQALQRKILQLHTGPDCYWRPTGSATSSIPTSFFGRASVIPFPFVLVFRYDEGSLNATLTEESELEAYIQQNEDAQVLKAKKVRLALRALENEKCFFPYSATRRSGKSKAWFASDLEMDVLVHYTQGVLRIERNADYLWQGWNYNSGFRVSMVLVDGRARRTDGTQEDGIVHTLSAEELGIGPSFELSSRLASFLRDNRHLVEQASPSVRRKLHEHRQFFARDALLKEATLSYAFLVDVYGADGLDDKTLEAALEGEQDAKVRSLPSRHSGSLAFMQERLRVVNRDLACQWWYVIWDDMWRRNADTVPQLRQNEQDFSPIYRTSICYRPMGRKSLQEFLDHRGLWSRDGKKGFFNHGVLNRIYFYLDEMLFEGTKGVIPIRVGALHRHEVDFHDLDRLEPFDKEDSFGQSTLRTLDTGRGTEHDDSEIRQRSVFLFEEIFERPAFANGASGRLRVLAHNVSVSVLTWIGWRPFEAKRKVPNIYFSLREGPEAFGLPRR